MSGPEDGGLHLRVRVYYQFEKPRNGYQLLVNVGRKWWHCENGKYHIDSSVVMDRLKHIDKRYTAHVYSEEVECFVKLEKEGGVAYLEEHERQKGVAPRLDVKLIEDGSDVKQREEIARSITCNSAQTSLTGCWFGIGIIRGKSASNHGSLWRSALQFGAALTFTIGKRYDKKVEGCADMYKTHRQIPCMAYENWETMLRNCAVDAKIVVVEYGGEDVSRFAHPKRAIYVLGSEDGGVPPSLVQRAHCHVSVPTAEGRPSSLNVAAAGAVVMYDRFVKVSGDGRNAKRGRAENGDDEDEKTVT
ncbi:hypothetical protein BWQ96_01012 [Gracilariopsis chorda]|uniref:tRNA/rRNA methyltransferase SpoU type domain-containing protein n=1 Tax=Gracilariopsis chorda TaxID=448386 RepID=A0A2V3J4I6_9FLOR|nr:hypothetical protein BWQ96_01012 [Gracilariopsis chorda]|eukprot:PXF49223.1 hypothetical protein BWQ96_01012 [Gracilariopsis chorda]